jgi:uncharacterized membrane protein (DUF485 family)
MLRSLLRTALPLAARRGLKTALRRFGRNAAAWLIAVLFLVAALVFALIALYGVLLQTQLTAPAAAGIMAGGLVAAAVLVLAILTIRNRRDTRAGATASNPHNIEDTIASADRQATRLMQQIGPAGLLVAAFAIGVSAGRNRGKAS